MSLEEQMKFLKTLKHQLKASGSFQSSILVLFSKWRFKVFIATIGNPPFWPIADNFLNSLQKNWMKIKIALVEVGGNAHFCKVEIQTEYRISIWE